MTGWNLPPGCNVSDIPGNGAGDDRCVVCGHDCAECICPECPVCPDHVQGDPSCYQRGHLQLSPEQQAAQKAMEEEARLDDWAGVPIELGDHVID